MNVEIKKLANGLWVACDNMKNVQSVSFKILVKVGSRNEKIGKNTGMSHFMEHMAFKGTKTFTKKQIATSLDRLGGSYNAYTSKEYTAYTCRVPRIYFEEAFAIFADIVRNSVFSENEILIERDVILQEMAMVNDDPSDIIFDRLYEISYGDDQIFGKQILGNVSELLKFERKDFLDFAKSYYHNENIIIGATGNLDFEDLEKLCEKFFYNSGEKIYSESGAEEIILKKENFEKPIFTGGNFFEKRAIEQAHVLFGFEGFEKKHKDYFASQIAISVLGGGMSSRLFQRIREELGLVYSVSSWAAGYFDTGLAGIYGACSPEKANLFIKECHQEVKKLIDDFSEEELESMKKQIRCGVLMQTDGTSSRVNHMVSSLFHFDKYISGEQLIEKINEVKLEKVKKVLFQIFFENKMKKSFAVITSEEDQKIEKNRVMSPEEFEKLWVF
jgi:predicted Zn-dependent peptidase